MSVSFTEAAGRHAADAALLDEAERVANADHLWGFAAECALKAVLRAVDPTLFLPDGRPRAPYMQHIDQLWPLVATFLAGRSESYLSSVLPAATNPFDRWSVHGRYDANVDAPRPEIHEQHQTAANLCLLLLETASSYGHRE